MRHRQGLVQGAGIRRHGIGGLRRGRLGQAGQAIGEIVDDRKDLQEKLRDLASFRCFIFSLCSSRIFLRAFSSHSLWNEEPSMDSALFLTGPHAESMSTEGEKTWIWSKTPA